MTSTPIGYHLSLHSLNKMAYIQIPSICIPRVWHKFDRNYVEGIFCELFGPNANGESCVIRIDMIPKKDRNTGEDFWVVFVHFSPDIFSSDYLVDFSNRIVNDEEVRIQYNPPWFWKVRKNKGTRKERARAGPRIMSPKDEEEFMAKQKEILAERTAIQAQNDTNRPDKIQGEKRQVNNLPSWMTLDGVCSDGDVSEIPPVPVLKRTATKNLVEVEKILKTEPPPLEWGMDAEEAEGH